ncbi:hypothetical protein HK096_002775 [Nowakowskiella sp. JEL0078]|nr:hypothetical protein HK096_002775 [Nowakowskiella sp. JEL0078]
MQNDVQTKNVINSDSSSSFNVMEHFPELPSIFFNPQSESKNLGLFHGNSKIRRRASSNERTTNNLPILHQRMWSEPHNTQVKKANLPLLKSSEASEFQNSDQQNSFRNKTILRKVSVPDPLRKKHDGVEKEILNTPKIAEKKSQFSNTLFHTKTEQREFKDPQSINKNSGNDSAKKQRINQNLNTVQSNDTQLFLMFDGRRFHNVRKPSAKAAPSSEDPFTDIQSKPDYHSEVATYSIDIVSMKNQIIDEKSTSGVIPSRRTSMIEHGPPVLIFGKLKAVEEKITTGTIDIVSINKIWGSVISKELDTEPSNAHIFTRKKRDNLTEYQFSIARWRWRAAIRGVIRLNKHLNELQRETHTESITTGKCIRRNIENMLSLFPMKSQDLMLASRMHDVLLKANHRLSKDQVAEIDKILIPRLRNLTEVSFKRRKRLYDACYFKTFAKGDMIFQELKRIHSVYWILNGTVRVHAWRKSTENPFSNDQTLFLAKSGDSLSDLSLFDHDKCWTASATSLTLCDILCIDFDSYLQISFVPFSGSELHERVKLLSTLPGFFSCSEYILRQFLPFTEILEFNPSNGGEKTIIGEGAEISKVYFITEGACLATRTAKFIQRPAPDFDKLMAWSKDIKQEQNDKIIKEDLFVANLSYNKVFPDVYSAFPAFIQKRVKEIWGDSGARFLKDKEIKHLVVPLSRSSVTVTVLKATKCVAFDITKFLQYATNDLMKPLAESVTLAVSLHTLQQNYIKKKVDDGEFKAG